MTQMRYADPRLWSEGGLSIPLKPGATYHLDDNGPPGIEARFDNSSTPMPLGPGATFKVPDGNGMTAFRMGMWRRGAPDFNASIVTNMAPQAGTTPEAYFLRNAQFQLREGWYSGPNGLLPGDGPLFVHAFDGTQKVIPLLAFFTAAQLARAKSLVIDYGARGIAGADVVTPNCLTQPVIGFYLRRPGAAATGVAWSQQRKQWGGASDRTAITQYPIFEELRFVFDGPFSPLDCVHVEDYAGGAAGPGASWPRFSLRLHEGAVKEMAHVGMSTQTNFGMGTTADILLCLASDKLHLVDSILSCTAIGTSTKLVALDDTGSVAGGYGRAQYVGVAGSILRRELPRAYQGRYRLAVDASGAAAYLKNLRLIYTEGESRNSVPA